MLDVFVSLMLVTTVSSSISSFSSMVAMPALEEAAALAEAEPEALELAHPARPRPATAVAVAATKPRRVRLYIVGSSFPLFNVSSNACFDFACCMTYIRRMPILVVDYIGHLREFQVKTVEK